MRSKKLSYFVFSHSAIGFGKLMIIVISIALGKNASDKKLEYKEELRRM